MNFVHWQKKCLSGNEFRPLTNKMSVRLMRFFHWQTNHLSVLNVLVDAHWQTKCLSGIVVFPLTDEMSVNRNPMVNEFRPLTDETSVYHRRSLDRAFLSFLLLTDISSVSETKNNKIWSKTNTVINIDRPHSVTELEVRLHWQTVFCQSMNLSSLTEEMSVSNAKA